MDPVDFLFRHHPFDGLPPPARARAEREIQVEFAGRDEVILERGGPPNDAVFMVHRGAVRLETENRLLQVLEEGEMFGYPSLLAGTAPTVDVTAEEESLLLRIPGPCFEAWMGEPGFAEFFLAGLADRLRVASAAESSPLPGSLATEVGDLVTRPPVTIAADASVAEGARRMTDERVSSLLVLGGETGILTDRDLRARVVAEGRDGGTPVREVMSSPLTTAPASASVFEALLTMLEARIHHLPLERGGEVVGVVTDTDLLRHQIKSPLHLLGRIEKLERAEAFPGYRGELAGMVDVLFQGGLDATRIGRIVSSIHDAAVGRLLRLAEKELGAPPAPYAWIVFGSAGRREQTLLTDQDNALVHGEDGEDGEAVADYFAALAERVVEGLVALSIPRCPGGFMATRWCHPLPGWVRLFRGWMESPDPRALVEAANLFDFRAVGTGELDLGPLREVVAGAPRRRVFLAQMARNALELRPPLGLLGRVRKVAEGIDLKKGGILPVVALARVYALESGSAERGTLERLRAAAEAGSVSRQGAENLAEAFRFLQRIRLARQLEARRAGGAVDNLLPPGSLPPLERRHLKDCFQAIREMQDDLASRYRTDLLG